MPALTANLRVFYHIISIGDNTVVHKFMIFRPKYLFKHFRGERGSLRLLARSLPEPVGIYPRVIVLQKERPSSTSLTVPSPPTTTMILGS